MNGQAGKVARRLNAVLVPRVAETDGRLLERFVLHREAEALDALVHRHGGMVWGVCRRVLRNHQDAEDAFQATFLVLVRKAASVTPREMVGNWLHGVARRTAMKARATALKRRMRERVVADVPEPAATESVAREDVRLVLDQALGCLPDKYRAAIVLCDLEGRTRTEAAGHIGCPEGTLAARLARGRVLLTKRLQRLGWPASAGALTAALSEEASAGVPVETASKTIAAACRYASGPEVSAGLVSSSVASLTEGVLKAMWMTRLKAVVTSVLGCSIAALASGMLLLSMTSAGDGVPKPPANADEKPKAGETDPEGPLTVTVQSRRTQVRLREPFDAVLRVVNSSKAPQTFRTMSCSWDQHWKANTDRLDWSRWVCTVNYPKSVTLKPGEAYEKTLSLFVVKGEPEDKVAFKMGFTPIDSKQTYWSGEVTIRVEPRDTTKQDVAGLQGTWEAVAVEREGKPLVDAEMKKLNLRFTVKGDGFTLKTPAAEHFPTGTFTIDPSRLPRAINFAVVPPVRAGRNTSTVLGIYELDGDNLKLMLAKPGQERPAEFKTMPKTDREVFTFKRAKE
jgi:RNA polymerase sigma factor (sigma-70 family)